MESVDSLGLRRMASCVLLLASFGISQSLRSIPALRNAVEANAVALVSAGAEAKIMALDYDKNSSCKPNLIRYSQAMNLTNKTQSEIKAHLKRTRKTRVRETCAKYNTASYAQASFLETADLCARINAHLASLKK